jgi:hypothetical protein
MFKSPDDLAKAALNLLEMSALPEIAKVPARTGALELSAAILANHVCDWHIRSRGLKGADGVAYFEQVHPEWPILKEIANGTKHPHRKRADVSGVASREAEFEDDDWWYSVQGQSTLFIEVDGKERSVHALAWAFCTSYLAKQNPNVIA